MLGCLRALATNKITTKMENNNFSTTNVEVPLQITMKDPKKVAQGKTLAEWNRKNKKAGSAR